MTTKTKTLKFKRRTVERWGVYSNKGELMHECASRRAGRELAKQYGVSQARNVVRVRVTTAPL